MRTAHARTAVTLYHLSLMAMFGVLMFFGKLLMEGLPAVLKRMPYSRTPDGIFLLPGVLSRKKQLLPQLLSITSGSQG